MASDNIDSVFSEEYDEEVLEAAKILLSIKHKRMSYEEARKLQEEDDEISKDFPLLHLRCFIKNCSIVIEKQLTYSDIREDQNRLNLTKKIVKEKFLSLLKDDEDVIKGIPVTVYDIQGNKYAMKFNYWSQKFYVLNGGWKDFVKDHGLRPNEDWVKVWMFRHSQTDQLCFVITHSRRTVSQSEDQERRIKQE